MKILFISAANSIHTVKWVNSLSERGHQVYLIY
ncbi:MAG: glycosyltransferase, partial [Lachnospiraceae bacterium]